MCLNSLTETHDPPLQEIRKGWKILRQVLQNLVTPFEHRILYRNVWNTSSDTTLRTEQWGLDGYNRERMRRPYLSGFHVFANENDAITAQILLRFQYYELVAVEVTDIVAEGLDGASDDPAYLRPGLPCLVAKKLRLL